MTDDEHEFWEALRLPMMLTPGLGSGWCDCVEPHSYSLGRLKSEIRGQIHIVGGNASLIPFVLHLGRQPESPEQISWADLLPKGKEFIGDAQFKDGIVHLRLFRPKQT